MVLQRSGAFPNPQIPKQDVAPASGFKPIKWQFSGPRKGPSGIAQFGIVSSIVLFGFYFVAKQHYFQRRDDAARIVRNAIQSEAYRDLETKNVTDISLQKNIRILEQLHAKYAKDSQSSHH